MVDGENRMGIERGGSSLAWVRVLIWIALAAIGITVLVITFSGGLVPDERQEPAGPSPTSFPPSPPR